MSKLTRRSLIGSSVVAGVAAIPALQTLAAIPPESPVVGNDRAIGELAEIKRLIAELIAIDDEVAEADEANDDEREAVAQTEHQRIYSRFRELAAEIQDRPPRGWMDIVVRAEIAAYSVLWKKPRSDWGSLVALFDKEVCDWARSDAALALGVLWLAQREGGQAHV